MTTQRKWIWMALLGGWLAGAAGVRADPRQDLSLNEDWKFIREDVSGAAAPGWDDAAWQAVNLPHTWNAQDGQDGGNNYYRGPAWYRRHLKLDNGPADKSLFLKFDGAATVAEVYVNGQSVGTHAGNFGAFCFDVTSALRAGQDNVIAVRVNNAHNENIPPLSGDFTVFGGLYRGVRLLALNPLSISPLDQAAPGVYLKPVHVDEAAAQVEITVKLRNAGASARTVAVRCRIMDHAGREVAAATMSRKLKPQTTADATGSLTVPRPHLWNGRADPYLYRAVVEVSDEAGVVDQVTQPLGLRYFRMDPTQGFFLNGKHYDLHGVNRHQDRLDKGWAIGPAEHREDVDLIMEMGCTAVRLAHYQQAQEFYDLCDERGLVVWAELALVNQINPTEAFAANTRQQLAELIKQSYNHPAIICWSLFNELALGDKATEQSNLIYELNLLAKDLDATRLTTAANCSRLDHRQNYFPDVLAYNRYYGWYEGHLADVGRKLDEHHARYPVRCLGFSEYGAGASIRQHEAEPVAQPKPKGAWHPEEWQALFHETYLREFKTRPWIWGTFVWNMFDFAADQRQEGDQPGRNDKGLMTYDRKTKKDAFFLYQANWSDAPVLYITSRRFERRTQAQTAVKIYSNCGRVELKVNGVALGAQVPDDLRIVRWENVALKPGANRIEAAGERGGKACTDACVWTLAPAQSAGP